MPEIAPKPLRADAARNRERILAAAHEEFATHGDSAQIDDIAQRAALGVGTLYRHFPTKRDLLVALMAENFAKLRDEARAALRHPDPWEAFAGFLRHAAEHKASNRGLADAINQSQSGVITEAQDAVDFHSAVAALLARAQEAGAVRADVTYDDVPAIMCAVGQGDSWQRVIELVLDGMRA